MANPKKKITVADIQEALRAGRNMSPVLEGSKNLTLEEAIAEFERQGWEVVDKPASGAQGTVDDKPQGTTGRGRHRRKKPGK